MPREEKPCRTNLCPEENAEKGKQSTQVPHYTMCRTCASSIAPHQKLLRDLNFCSTTALNQSQHCPNVLYGPTVIFKFSSLNKPCSREGSSVKSTGCPSQRPQFNSQNPHGEKGKDGPLFPFLYNKKRKRKKRGKEEGRKRKAERVGREREREIPNIF